MNREQLEDRIRETLSDIGDISDVRNQYCDKNKYYEDRIYHMYEFDDFYADSTPTQIAFDLKGSDFDIDDNFFTQGIHGLQSYNDACDAIDKYQEQDLVDYIIDNDDSLGCEEIRDVLDEADEDEDEDEDED